MINYIVLKPPKIEEALKLYQNALKLHSQGSSFYEEAEAAYKELFRSEIFTYVESLSESQWLEKFGDGELPEELVPEEVVTELPALNTTGEGASSTLPQVLYLAYKNYGQFRLDRLRDQLDQLEDGLKSDTSIADAHEISITAAAGLRDLAEALDRDEGDLELWRKVARVGEFLGSRRLARFCLETVLNTDGSDPTIEVEPLSIEEIFANEQIAPLLASIDSEMARSLPRYFPGTPQFVIKPLRKHIDPCPYLPIASFKSLGQHDEPHTEEQEIQVPHKTWASCGKAILHRQKQETQGFETSRIGARYLLKMPLEGSAGQSGTFSKTNGPSDSDNADSRSIDAAQIVSAAPIQADGNISLATLESPSNIIHSPTKSEKTSAGTRTDSLVDVIGEGGEATEIVPTHTERDHGNMQEETNPGVTMVLPTRKRTSELAELQDGPEPGRARSKRIKARGSMNDPSTLKDTTAEDWTKWFKQQLQIYVKADKAAFASAYRSLSKFGCHAIELVVDDGEVIEEETSSQSSAMARTDSESLNFVRQDMSELLDVWDFSKSKLLLSGDGGKSSASGNASFSKASFSTFLAQSMENHTVATEQDILQDDKDLDSFVKYVNESEWINLNQVALLWLRRLLEIRSLGAQDLKSLYETHRFPDDLKQVVVQLLISQDDFIYEEVNRSVSELREVDSIVEIGDHTPALSYQEDLKLIAFVEVIFELQLDIYGRITNPSSEVDMPTREAQCDRLLRWALLANSAVDHAVQFRSRYESWAEQIQYRFIWASIVQHNVLEPAMIQVTVTYFQDLTRQFKQDASERATSPPIIVLPNNAIMPEVSVEAADREISRLTTLDFFTTIFSSRDDNPMAVIENLEPLLALSVRATNDAAQSSIAYGKSDTNSTPNGDLSPENLGDNLDPRLAEALQYLNRASISLKLFLWQRLQDAYSVINYPPEILSSNLWCFIIIMRHLQSEEYRKTQINARRDGLLRWLHKVDELMTQILALASTDSAAFESVDFTQISAAMEALNVLQHITHTFAVWEDTIRVGQTQPTPQPSSAATKAQLRAAEKLREMIVKTWTLQYVFIKEAATQSGNPSSMNQDLLAYMRSAHEALGLRTYCGLANKLMLKMIKSELLKLMEVDGWESEMTQVIFDLYGLKITSNPNDVQDHLCEGGELDKSTALEILDLVMLHVNRLSIKELLKNDLKFAIDKMQQVIRIPRASSGTNARTFNKRLVNLYLKSPINPAELYRSLRGIGELCGTPARTDGWTVAAKGWYFLVGHLYLVKFRSQKRIAAGSLDDLENTKAMFKQDLEFNTERWETWYRLAQAYDTQVDENVTWSAEKIQNDMATLIDLQRKAILCYAMAVAVAKRSETPSFESTSNMASLYADFGSRIYASSREPFSMKAFETGDFKRKYNHATQGMYEGIPFPPLHIYSAWKLASALLKQASKQKPHDWR